MNGIIENRIVRDYYNWTEKEKTFENALGSNLKSNKSFLRLKLDFIDSLPKKYANSLSLQEIMAIKALQTQKNEIIGMLYPGILQSTIYNLLLKFKNKSSLEVTQNEREKNISSIQRTLDAMGFGDHSKQIERKIRNGSDEFKISVSQFFNATDSVNFDFHIKEYSGDFRIEKIHALLVDGTNTLNKRQQRFNLSDGIVLSPLRIYNLLCGRSIVSNPNLVKSNLIKIDFDDIFDGKYRFKTFNSEGSADLKSILNTMPDEIKTDTKLMVDLEQSFENGDRPTWTYTKDGIDTIYKMEVDPLTSSVQLYNHSNRIDFKEVFNNSTPSLPKVETTKVEVPSTKFSRKKANSIN